MPHPPFSHSSRLFLSASFLIVPGSAAPGTADGMSAQQRVSPALPHRRHHRPSAAGHRQCAEGSAGQPRHPLHAHQGEVQWGRAGRGLCSLHVHGGGGL